MTTITISVDWENKIVYVNDRPIISNTEQIIIRENNNKRSFESAHKKPKYENKSSISEIKMQKIINYCKENAKNVLTEHLKKRISENKIYNNEQSLIPEPPKPSKYYYRELLKVLPEYFVNIPHEFLDEEICSFAIRKDPKNFKFVPNCYKNLIECEYVSKFWADSIDYMPNKLILSDNVILGIISLNIVKLDGMKLKEIQQLINQKNNFDDKFDKNCECTRENIYKCAVSKIGESLQYVPSEYQTPELILIAVKQNKENSKFVTNVILKEIMDRV